MGKMKKDELAVANVSMATLAASGIKFDVTKEDLFELVLEKAKEEAGARLAAAHTAHKRATAAVIADRMAAARKACKKWLKLVGPSGKLEVYTCPSGDDVEVVSYKLDYLAEGESVVVSGRTSFVPNSKMREDWERTGEELRRCENEIRELSRGTQKIRLQLVRQLLGTTPEGQRILEMLRGVPRPVKVIDI